MTGRLPHRLLFGKKQCLKPWRSYSYPSIGIPDGGNHCEKLRWGRAYVALGWRDAALAWAGSALGWRDAALVLIGLARCALHGLKKSIVVKRKKSGLACHS